MLQIIQTRIQQHRPRMMAVNMPEAAVLMPLTDEKNPMLVLTLRSDEMPTHRGEVAFPGGRRDINDTTLIDTALRESHEEIGLFPQSVQVVGQLDQVVSRYGYKVTPIVGIIPTDVSLQANPAEIADMFQVPLEFFLEDKRLRTDRITFLQQTVDIPCYEYKGYQIWGLTALMIVEFLNLTLDAGISLLDKNAR